MEARRQVKKQCQNEYGRLNPQGAIIKKDLENDLEYKKMIESTKQCEEKTKQIELEEITKQKEFEEITKQKEYEMKKIDYNLEMLKIKKSIMSEI